MKNFLIGLVVFGGFATVGGCTVITSKFKAEKLEQAIIAQDENMQNVHGSMTNILKTQGFTVKNYTESDIKKLEVAIKRYEGKPNMLMQWVQESGNSLDPQLHSKFMTAVEKNYKNWEMVQKNKISVTQEYRQYLNASVKGMIASSFFGYPTSEVETIMDRIISTDNTKETWATGSMKAENPFE